MLHIGFIRFPVDLFSATKRTAIAVFAFVTKDVPFVFATVKKNKGTTEDTTTGFVTTGWALGIVSHRTKQLLKSGLK